MGAGASAPKTFPPLQLRQHDSNAFEKASLDSSELGDEQQRGVSSKNASGLANQNLYLASTIPSIVISAKKLAAARRKEQEEEKKKLLAEYPELADSLDSAHEWMKDIAEDKEADVAKGTMGLRTRKWLDELYILYFEHDPQEHKKVIADQIAADKAGQIFTEYMKALTEDGKKTPVTGYKSECLQAIRSLCWNYSDASLEFCGDLGRVGMFPILVADLVTFYPTIENPHIGSSIILPSLSILHNCAKAVDNKKYLKEAKAVEAVTPYTKVEDPELKMISMMTLAYIIDEKDNEIISADGSMIKFILLHLKGAIQSYDHKYEGFSAHEVVSGLMHLANNDKNKATIVAEGVLPMLVELMRKGSDPEKAISAKTVWVLSFSNENKAAIRAENGMMENLKLLSKSTGSAKESASGALWVLDDEERVRKIRSEVESTRLSQVTKSKSTAPAKKKKVGGKVSIKAESEAETTLNMESSFSAAKVITKPNEQKQIFEGKMGSVKSETEREQEEEEEEDEDDDDWREVNQQESRKNYSSDPKHIMISYQWACQKLMLRVKERLRKQNYLVWIDVDSMGGSTLQAMADAVENSDVVLICMSQKYKDSPNCRTEAEYAYKLGKALIPIRVEPMYEPDGWLGALQGAKFYFDFSNLMAFENMISKLIKEIGDRGKAKIFDEPDGPIPPPALARQAFAQPLDTPQRQAKNIPVVKWGREDVEKWASLNSITSRKVLHLDGESLVFLNGLKSSAPEFFYKYVSDKLGVSELRDLMNLSKGLDSL